MTYTTNSEDTVWDERFERIKYFVKPSYSLTKLWHYWDKQRHSPITLLNRRIILTETMTEAFLILTDNV